MSRLFVSLCSAVAVLSVAGCGGPDAAGTASSPAEQVSSIDRAYLATVEPAGATPVGEARQSVVDGQQTTLVGIIGGSAEPFVEGMVAFTIVDPKIPYCAPEEGCPTPWDYCCTQDQVKDNIATIKVVDNSGALLRQDAKQTLGLQELSTIVVSGTAERDEAGNLTLVANQVFVKK